MLTPSPIIIRLHIDLHQLDLINQSVWTVLYTQNNDIMQLMKESKIAEKKRKEKFKNNERKK